MKKIILLDIDGVLNSEINQDYNFSKGRWSSRNLVLDSDAIRCLKEIVDKTGAEIILSSTWRYPDEDDSFVSKENFIRQLGLSGMTLSGETPQLPEYDRAAEILAYLNEHPEVTHFVIIDDDIDLMKHEELRKHLLHTNYRIGLVKSEIDEAINILDKVREI